MKTPKEFDYDLWVTKDGKYMVRVKSTGEVTEVAPAVMRSLRAAEKKLRRDISERKHELLLDILPTGSDEVGESWLADTYDFQNDIIVALLTSDFCRCLTPNQLSVFRECIVNGKPINEYAAENRKTKQSVSDTIEQIRKKAKKFLGDT